MPDLNTKTPNNLPTDSQIKRSGLNQFLSTLFGWRRNRSNGGTNSIEFTKVDVGSEQRVNQALVNKLAAESSGPFNQKLETLFNSWLNDNTDKLNDIVKRRQRVDQLQYAVLNDPYINRAVNMYADEATQLDEQDTLINIETPDPRMTRDMYNLLNQWGVTQTRIRAAIEQLAIYGDAFWANRVTENGIERIIPLQQLQVSDRLEFNPVKALEMKKRREGAFSTFASSNYLIDEMLKGMEDNSNFADLFDTKLFGFTIENDTVVPPWTITHFRLGSESSEFYPMGTSPILGTLAPFKQTQSTIALQSLARTMNFPTTIYKVKSSENMDEGRQFSLVNRVRESYDNIGIAAQQGGSEVYTVNTKIWVPDGLLDVDVKKADINVDDIGDLEFYQNRTAVATGLPNSYFNNDGPDSNMSGKSLVREFKPFARKVFSMQSAFLDGLANNFRIHYAITGEYDFRIPFTLSMKFPAVEEGDERQRARKDSIEVADAVVDLVKKAIGAGEDDSLPPDIIRDIINKYTFLDPSDLMKWTRDATYMVRKNSDEEDEGGAGGGSDFGGGDFGGGSDFSDLGEEGSDLGNEEFEPTEEALNSNEPAMPAEAPAETPTETATTTNESKKMHDARLRELQLKEKRFCEKYNANKNQIYFDALRESAVNNFVRHDSHVQVFNTADSCMEPMLETLSKNSGAGDRQTLRESMSLFTEK